jgi:hypothetical protein
MQEHNPQRQTFSCAVALVLSTGKIERQNDLTDCESLQAYLSEDFFVENIGNYISFVCVRRLDAFLWSRFKS